MAVVGGCVCELVLIAFTIISVRRGLLCLPRRRSIAKNQKNADFRKDRNGQNLRTSHHPLQAGLKLQQGSISSAVRLSAACSSPSSLRSA